MASPEPCAAAAGAVDGVLPPELLLEVLLRLPAKPICCLRGRLPLVAVLHHGPALPRRLRRRPPSPAPRRLRQQLPQRCGVDLVDLSGNVVEEIRGVGGECRVVTASQDRVLVVGEHHSVSVLDPATGSVSALPFGIAEDIARRNGMRPAWFAFGQTDSTGEYKLLRILEDFEDVYEADPWRKMGSPPGYLDLSCTNGVVFEGAAYFFLDHWQLDPSYYFATGCIPSFNLTTDPWNTGLQRPVNRILEEANGTLNYADLTDRLMLAQLEGTLCTAHLNDRISAVDLCYRMKPVNRILEEANGTLNYADLTDRLMLAQLEGTLCTAHLNDRISAVDLWFLVDFENGTNTSSEIVQTKAKIFNGVEMEEVLKEEEQNKRQDWCDGILENLRPLLKTMTLLDIVVQATGVLLFLVLQVKVVN
uniref:F-box domain-containing protein n=1 Tax=Oryza punctata TaxID=4537 RepID=A0A0E0LIU9_ORYPU